MSRIGGAGGDEWAGGWARGGPVRGTILSSLASAVLAREPEPLCVVRLLPLTGGAATGARGVRWPAREGVMLAWAPAGGPFF